jgi:hypothetical protein
MLLFQVLTTIYFIKTLINIVNHPSSSKGTDKIMSTSSSEIAFISGKLYVLI